MKPLHKSLLIWTTTIMAVLSVLQQQASTFPPEWAAGLTVVLAAVAFWRQWLDGVQLPDVSPWRAIFTSVPLWCGLGMAAATALQQYTHLLPQSVATALTTVLAVLPVIARGNAALYAEPPAKSAGESQGQRGFVRLGLLAVLAGLAVIGLLAGCSAPQRWPSSCTTIERNGQQVLQCKCKPWGVALDPHPGGKPRPAGAVIFACSGQQLPIEVVTDDVNLPACQP